MSAIPLDRLRDLPPLWRESRVPAELASLWRDPVFAGAGVPRGRGEPVLLIPGYMAGDPSLATLTFWLRRLGYRTSRAGIRANIDCGGSTLARLEERLAALKERYGRRVAIVGQSRGGALARALGARRPDLVSGIVTLGSPLRDPLAVHPLVRLNVRAIATLGRLGLPGLISYDCADGDCCAELRAAWEADWPAGVGFVSVYSRSDGIVDWRACFDDGASSHEIDSSHCGMSVHPDAYRVIGQALRDFDVSPVTPQLRTFPGVAEGPTG
jgi:pimeloyl-ACP methyl ester carboxylesterase